MLIVGFAFIIGAIYTFFEKEDFDELLNINSRIIPTLSE
jgi:hypothetical protein